MRHVGVLVCVLAFLAGVISIGTERICVGKEGIPYRLIGRVVSVHSPNGRLVTVAPARLSSPPSGHVLGSCGRICVGCIAFLSEVISIGSENVRVGKNKVSYRAIRRVVYDHLSSGRHIGAAVALAQARFASWFVVHVLGCCGRIRAVVANLFHFLAIEENRDRATLVVC